MPPNGQSSDTKKGITAHITGAGVSSRYVLVAGLILAIFNPPKIGLIYALCFVFHKETRKAALIIAAWSLVWAVIYAFLLSAAFTAFAQ